MKTYSNNTLLLYYKMER